MHKIWFNDTLQQYRWVFIPEGTTQHYNGNAKSFEQALADIEVCRDYHESLQTTYGTGT